MCQLSSLSFADKNAKSHRQCTILKKFSLFSQLYNNKICIYTGNAKGLPLKTPIQACGLSARWTCWSSAVFPFLWMTITHSSISDLSCIIRINLSSLKFILSGEASEAIKTRYNNIESKVQCVFRAHAQFKGENLVPSTGHLSTDGHVVGVYFTLVNSH